MTDSDTEWLSALNTPQKLAVTNPAKQVLVIAGAGSGKTRVLVSRILWYIKERSLTPSRIMAVTFTNKAAKEMRARLEKSLGYSVGVMWMGTFHGIAHRMLRSHWEAAGLPENFQIIDGDDQKRLIKNILKEAHLDDQVYEPKQIISYISKEKDEGRRSQHATTVGYERQAVLQMVYDRYEKQCNKMGLVDFGELLLRAYELLNKNPAICDAYKRQFPCLLVDEFQDTNGIQYAWMRKLCDKTQDLMVVGDDDQSIYGWRGAKIENIQRFNQDYPEAAVVRLEQNYRSTKAILKAANSLIAINENRLGKDLWTAGDAGDCIDVFGAFNEVDEARYIVDRIQYNRPLGINYEDIAILYRSNAQSRVLEQALRQANIPYRIYGGLRFFERAEIRDVLAYLRLIMNPSDDPAFERVINVPPRGVGDKTLSQIRLKATELGVSLMDATRAFIPEATTRQATGLSKFIQMIDSFKPKEMRIAQMVEQLTEEQGLRDYYRLQSGERGQTKAENLAELLIAVAQFEESYIGEETALQSFLSEIALDTSQEGGAEDEKCVCMMTLHASKGLEFPHVYIGGLEEGLFPNHRCQHEQSLLEEERRLCYVGITRAMKKLTLTYAERRAFSGNKTGSQISRFIAEIPSELLEHISTAANHRVLVGKPAVEPPPRTRPHKRSSRRVAAAEGCDFAVGQRVTHAKFGEGIIMHGEGSGDAARLQINFDQVGVKWLVLGYAKLQAV